MAALGFRRVSSEVDGIIPLASMNGLDEARDVPSPALSDADSGIVTPTKSLTGSKVKVITNPSPEELAARVQQLSLNASKKVEELASGNVAGDRLRCDTPAPAMGLDMMQPFMSIAHEVHADNAAFPDFFDTSVDFEQVRSTVIPKFDGYTAFFISMLLTSDTFLSIMLDSTRRGVTEAENNILKTKVIIPAIATFKRTGVLDLSKTGYILTRLHDAMKRSRSVIERTLANTIASIRYPMGKGGRRAASPIIFDSRQLRMPPTESPLMIEYFSKFADRFGKSGEFKVLSIPGSKVRVKDLEERLEVPATAKCLVFVRGHGWSPNDEELIFPSESVQANGKTYKLKSIIACAPISSRLTYKSYMIDNGKLHAHYTAYAHTADGESSVHRYTPSDIFDSEGRFFRGGEAKIIAPELSQFVLAMMRFTDALVYEELPVSEST